MSVSLNPSPPPPRRLGRGLRLAGGGRGDWRPARVRPSAWGARGAELRAGAGARIFHYRRARAAVLLASPGCARPARLRSRLCPRMGWGSGEERAGARAGRAQPLPDSAPAVRTQRASRRSADAPRSRGLAGIDASGPGAGDGRAAPESPGHPLARGGSDHPLPIPGCARLLDSGRGEVLGSHPNPHGIGAWERSGTSIKSGRLLSRLPGAGLSPPPRFPSHWGKRGLAAPPLFGARPGARVPGASLTEQLGGGKPSHDPHMGSLGSSLTGLRPMGLVGVMRSQWAQALILSPSGPVPLQAWVSWESPFSSSEFFPEESVTCQKAEWGVGEPLHLPLKWPG